MACDYSANIVVALRQVEPGELPLPCLSMLLEFSLLHFGAARARRKIRMRREVVEPPTETNAEDWLVAGRSTLSWCSTLKLGKQDWGVDSHEFGLRQLEWAGCCDTSVSALVWKTWFDRWWSASARGCTLRGVVAQMCVAPFVAWRPRSEPPRSHAPAVMAASPCRRDGLPTCSPCTWRSRLSCVCTLQDARRTL